MLSYNVIQDWYFCNCIKSPAERTATYLSILQILDMPQSDGRLLLQVIDELACCEIWEAVYGLPRLLVSLRASQMPPVFEERAHRYFSMILDYVHERFKPGLSETWEHKISNRPQRLLESIRAFLPLLGNYEVTVEYDLKTSTPYLSDTTLSLPVIVLLAIVHDSLLDEKFAAALAKELEKEEEEASLHQLVRQALDYEYGRQAFIHACHIAFQVKALRIGRNQILDKIREAASLCPALEPDLVQAFVYIRFADTEAPAGQVADNLLKELENYRAFLSFREDQYGAKEVSRLVMGRLGVIKNGQQPTLKALLWQQAVLHFAIRLAPGSVANQLKKWWHPIGMASHRWDIKAALPSFNRKKAKQLSEAEQQYINGLVSLKTFRPFQIRFLEIVEGANAEWQIPEDLFSLLLSPWQPMNEAFFKLKKYRRRSKYLHFISGNPLLPLLATRMISALGISFHMLQQPAVSDRNFLLSYLVHLYDVLKEVLLDFHHARKQDQTPALSVPLQGLLLAASQQLEQIANGMFESIQPIHFVNGLIREQNGKVFEGDEDAFFDTIVPVSLSRWAYDSYSIACGESPARQWMERDNYWDIYERMLRLRYAHSIQDRLVAEVVWRLLFSIENVSHEFDWKEGQAKTIKYIPEEETWRPEFNKEAGWAVRAEQLVLASTDLAAAWNPEGEQWHLPVYDEDKRGINEENIYLVIINRFESVLREEINQVGQGENPFSVDPVVIRQWQVDFRRMLEGFSPDILPTRRVKLRLLEILDMLLKYPKLDKTPEEDPPLAELIAYITLEFGYAYELEQLVRLLFDTRESFLLESWWDMMPLRKKVMMGLANVINLSAGNRRLQQDPTSPYVFYQDNIRLRIMQNALNLAAHLAGKYSDEEQVQPLRESLLHILEMELGLQKRSPYQEASRPVRINKTAKGRLIKTLENAPNRMFIRQLEFNPYLYEARLHYSAFDMPADYYDFLYLPAQKVERYEKNQVGWERMLCRAVFLDKRLQGQQEQLLFDCGFSKPVAQTLDRDEQTRFRRGSEYMIGLEWSAGSPGKGKGKNGQGSWVVEYSDSQRLRFIHNFFQIPDKRLRSYLNNEKLPDILPSVLAVYVTHNSRLKRIHFNCGFGAYVELDLQSKDLHQNYRKHFFHPGDYYLIHLRRDKGRQWAVDPSKPFQRYRPLKERPELEEMPLPDPRKATANEIPLLKYWYPDTQSFLRQNHSRRSYRYLVRYSKDIGGPTPYYGRLLNLLLEPRSGAGLVVLAFIEEQLGGQSGRRGFLFSLHPGINFRLYEDDFDFNTLDVVEEAIEETEETASAAGLLFAFQPEVMDSGRVLLRLAPEIPKDHPIHQQYPQLQAIDDRNIRWKMLFDTAQREDASGYNTQFIAQKDAGERKDGSTYWKWIYKLENPIPGFPAEIDVFFPEQQRRRIMQEDTVEFTVKDKDWSILEQLSNRVLVQPVDMYSLKLPPAEEDKRQVIEQFHQLRENGFLPGKILDKPLVDYQKGGNKNLLPVFSKNRFLFRVDVSGLSFEPVEEGAEPKWFGRRNFFVDIVINRVLQKPMAPQPFEVHFDDAELPKEIRNNGKGWAVFNKLPRDASFTRCGVVWYIPGQASKVIESDVNILNLEEFARAQQPIRTGYILEVRGDARKGWVGKVTERIIRLIPVWSREDFQDGAYSYLDKVGQQYFFQKAPGQLVMLDERSFDATFSQHFKDKTMPHLARLEMAMGSSGKIGIRSVEPLSGDWVISRGGSADAFYLTVEQQGHQQKILFGRPVSLEKGQRKLDFDNVRIHKKQVLENGFLLYRDFQFLNEIKRAKPKRTDQLPIQTKPTPAVEKPRRGHTERWRDNLRAELKNSQEGRPLENGIFKQPAKGLISYRVNPEIKFPYRTPAGETAWTDTIDLAEGEGSYIPSNQYNPNTTNFTIFETGEELSPGLGVCQASFRRHHYSLPQYFQTFGFSLGELERLDLPLYFVGKELENPALGMTYDEPMLRFEWGYGSCLLLKPEELTFNGEDFDVTQLAFFFGDSILAVTFSRLPSGKEDGQGALVMNINEIDINFSQATSLFLQRIRYGFVHVLHLKRSADQIHIDFIEGVNRRNELKANEDYTVERAVLAEKHHPDILQRGEDNPVILGRLDALEYYRSGGETVRFSHVWLSYEASSNHSALPLQRQPHADESEFSRSRLSHGEMTFFRTGRISPVRNDFIMNLRPLRELNRDDIGKDFRDMGILRRHFAVREDVLRKDFYLQWRSKKQLPSLLVPVRVSYNSVRKSPFFSMKDFIPPRRPGVLRGLLGQRKVIYGTFHRQAGDGEAFEIELQPSVFVHLRARQVVNPISFFMDLEEGDRLRITLSGQSNENGKPLLDLVLTAPGDRNYIGETPRPAVILPTNQLLQENAFDNFRMFFDTYYSVGGLPNLTPKPRSFDLKAKKWQDLDSWMIRHFMQAGHPKVGLLGREGTGRKASLVFNPYPGYPGAGAIAYDESGTIPYFKDLNGNVKQKLSWEYLTFSPYSAARLRKVIAEETWRYHDTETGTWVTENDGKKKDSIRLQQLGEHSGNTGPLFFAKGYSLRYFERELPDFGFPVDELFYSLSLCKKRKNTYTFAGRTVVTDGPDRLWVEISPGRIAELPPNLVVYISGKQEVISLENFNWQNLAHGDQLSLQLISGGRMQPESLRLVQYQPASRRSFGWKKCYAPVLEIDRENDGLTLGGGLFRVAIPYLASRINGEGPHLACIMPNNKIQIESLDRVAQKWAPENGDTVFLQVDDAGQITVVGFPAIKEIYPDTKFGDKRWRQDPFFNYLFKSYSNRLEFRPRKFARLIRAVGNRLPVTVEGIFPNDGRLFFSRHWQSNRDFLENGQVTIVQVIGLLEDEYILLRAGDELIRENIHRLLSGLPKRLTADQLQTLADHLAGLTTWARQENGMLHFGLKEEAAGSEPEVRIAAIVSLEEGKRIAGLICRSYKASNFYWMPEPFITWASLSADVLKQFFLKMQPLRKAKLTLEKGYRDRVAAFTKVSAIANEFNRLKINGTLSATPVCTLPKTDGSDGFPMLVANRSGMFLHCKSSVALDSSRNAGLAEEEFPVEIELKIEGKYNILHTVYGERIILPDLPLRLFGGRKGSPFPYNSQMVFQEILRSKNDKDNLQMVVEAFQNQFRDSASIRKFNAGREGIDIREELHAHYQLIFNFKDSLGKYRYLPELALYWLKDYMKDDEIELPYVLMALFLLRQLVRDNPRSEFAQHWKQEIVGVLHQIVIRAMRSKHSEAIADFLRHEGELGTDPLALRLDQVLLHLAKGGLSPDKLNYIKKFCDSVVLRGDMAYRDIALAFGKSIGYDVVMPQLETIRAVNPDTSGICATLSNLKFYLPPLDRSDLPNWWFDYSPIFAELKNILSLLESKEVILLDEIHI